MPIPICVRQARREHLPDICAINADSAQGLSLLAPNALDQVFDTASILWVASANERIVGYLIAFAPEAIYDGEEFAWFQLLVRNFLYVDQIAVTASHLSQRIGAASYLELEKIAERERCAAIVCEVNFAHRTRDRCRFTCDRGSQKSGASTL